MSRLDAEQRSWSRGAERVRSWLPTGRALPLEVWQKRHRVIVGLLWFFVLIVPIWTVWRGYGTRHAGQESMPVLFFAVLSSWPYLGRRVRSTTAALGLLVASATIVHLSGGVIEMHFLFFIMVGIITLYQDWIVFLLAVGFVAIHHGLVGVLDPHSVYNHYAAWNDPWKWAAIHAGFILAMSLVGIVAWKFNEQMREAIELSEERFRGQFEHAAVGEAMTALDGNFLEVNPALCEMLGYSADELLTLNTTAITLPEDRDRSAHQMQRVIDGECESYDIDKRYVRRDGSIVHVLVSVSSIRDAEGALQSFAGVIQDVTERKRAQDALEHQALHDALTGLPNRSLLLDRVSRALGRSERDGSLTALLFLDLDRFKSVNDSLGHIVGDDFLIAVAARLQTSIRSGDTVARFGGDEFIVLCEGLADVAEAKACAQRLMDELTAPLAVDDWTFPLSASIGIAVARPDERISANTLLSNADAALYRAKDNGRARYEMYDTDMRARAIDRLSTEHQLRRAIENRDLVVHYQPLVSIPTGEITGVEALVRWQHPTRGLVPPAEFIPLAEKLGLIIPLGELVLDESCRALSAWNSAHRSLRLDVSVNLSPKQVSAAGLPETIAGILETSGLDPSMLCLEITETALLEDVASNTSTLHSLKQLGLTIAVDDFGTGYSSLLYLKHLPVDVLKVDRSFTKGVGTDPHDTAIVGAVIDLAHALDLSTIAEGVEDEAQLAALATLGCDEAQGFLWTPALPLPELEEWLDARTVMHARTEAPARTEVPA